jgi:hypothetical protein
VGLFTSDLFLDAFAPVINAKPIFGHRMWITKRSIVKMGYSSPWNGFIENPDIFDLMQTGKKEGCWAITFVSSNLIDLPEVKELSPVPTIIVQPDYRPNKKVRWAEKKAREAGYEVYESSYAEAEKCLLLLWSKLGRSICKHFYERLISAGVGDFLVCKDKLDNVASVLFFLRDEKNVFYMYTLASDPKYYKTQATMLLVSEFIRKSFSENARYVDLCGISEPAIYRFKSNFSDTIRFRPRYLIVLKHLLWNMAKFGSHTIYKNLSKDIPNSENWKSYLVD